MYVHTTCILDAYGGQKIRVLDPLELELKTVVSHHESPEY